MISETSTIVQLTEEQSEQIQPLLQKLKAGEALMAQVYLTDMHIKLLTKDQATAIRSASGAHSYNGEFQSAQEALEARSRLQ